MGCPRKGNLQSFQMSLLTWKRAIQLNDLPDSHRQDFFFLRGRVRIDLGHVLIRELLDLFLGLFLFFFAGLAGFDRFLQFFHRIAAHMAYRYPAVFGHLLGDLHEFLTAFRTEFWKRDTDHLALRGGRKTEIRLLDGLFDRLNAAHVPWLDEELARFRRGDARELAD